MKHREKGQQSDASKWLSCERIRLHYKLCVFSQSQSLQYPAGFSRARCCTDTGPETTSGTAAEVAEYSPFFKGNGGNELKGIM